MIPLSGSGEDGKKGKGKRKINAKTDIPRLQRLHIRALNYNAKPLTPSVLAKQTLSGHPQPVEKTIEEGKSLYGE